MRRILAFSLAFSGLALLTATTALAGNTSSNSSSNSSNGVHTRIDTLVRDDDRGRRFYERRYRRSEGYRGRDGYRERGYGYGPRRRSRDDDDDQD
ncbi:hypothetical protein [Methylobacterium iners]|jgi:hypothetical protein|uniref:Uncharacterized protein n=1 Tax=Methylobacterium iners TaxID=418707 RepID=A0ABQ4RVA1_9HYPH|nr:hypothetical protein [Methylobacterium iners]GJD94711.1 hypothetical protein OCOJLMKI_1914 [Methylobacterium iners]